MRQDDSALKRIIEAAHKFEWIIETEAVIDEETNAVLECDLSQLSDGVNDAMRVPVYVINIIISCITSEIIRRGRGVDHDGVVSDGCLNRQDIGPTVEEVVYFRTC